MNKDKLSLYGVGDVWIRRENPQSIFALAAPTLNEADILFGQLENILSERGSPDAHGKPDHPGTVAALTCAGFDVMSLASNHSLNFGSDALLDTIDLLKKNGIMVTGAGANIDEARRPAIIERNGTRVAFLAYCSHLPKGYEAGTDKPGVVPMRVSTVYEQIDEQPGAPPRVVTFADKQDLEAMVEDIRKLRPLVDVLVVSMHGGVHIFPSLIAMYQREVGHAAIDAGADLVLGHGAHVLRGIEVYKGKVIFHSLCNFGADYPIERLLISTVFKIYGWEVDPEYAGYAFPRDSRKTIIAKCTISGKKIDRVSYLPATINREAQPEVLLRADKRSTEVFDYVGWLCKDQKLDTEFCREGDEVVIAV
ncbi:MAG: CapA family protein [Chloroflexi bacterium]|nr:CapA family protein [Chloroflexota bacterium]